MDRNCLTRVKVFNFRTESCILPAVFPSTMKRRKPCYPSREGKTIFRVCNLEYPQTVRFCRIPCASFGFGLHSPRAQQRMGRCANVTGGKQFNEFKFKNRKLIPFSLEISRPLLQTIGPHFATSLNKKGRRHTASKGELAPR